MVLGGPWDLVSTPRVLPEERLKEHQNRPKRHPKGEAKRAFQRRGPSRGPSWPWGLTDLWSEVEDLKSHINRRIEPSVEKALKIV